MESQNKEYKSIWKDEYLKTISAFANAQGGSLYIGLDDNGNATGLSDYQKLTVDLPNKIASTLGLMVDVNLLSKNLIFYIEMIVKPSEVAISYNGGYYYRSGSTTQELRGSALQEFLLRKMGRSWDDMPIQNASLSDINKDSIEKFQKYAIEQGRLLPESLYDDLETTLKKLHLINEKGELKCAALLLFGNDPLKFFRQTSFKIGRFGTSDHDLKFQDIIEGNIFEMTDKVFSILRSKYLTAPIVYEGHVRKEKLEYPEEALREAILNSIVHKDYAGTFIQLSVYDDRLTLWNPGLLPDELTVEKLKQKHASHPRNKNIADIFFKSGYIEAWGRGIAKIFDSFKNEGLPDPILSEEEGGFRITLFKDLFSEDNLQRIGLNKRQKKAIAYLKTNGKITNAIYVSLNNISKTTASRELRALVEKKLLKSTGIKGAGSEFSLNRIEVA